MHTNILFDSFDHSCTLIFPQWCSSAVTCSPKPVRNWQSCGQRLCLHSVEMISSTQHCVLKHMDSAPLPFCLLTLRLKSSQERQEIPNFIFNRKMLVTSTHKTSSSCLDRDLHHWYCVKESSLKVTDLIPYKYFRTHTLWIKVTSLWCSHID